MEAPITPATAATPAAALAPAPAPTARPLAGILWMLATGLLFLTGTVIVKAHGQRLPAAEAAFLRYALGLVFVLPLLGTLRRAAVPPRDWALFVLRGLVHALGVIAWFFAMTRIPLAEVTSIGYLSPVFVTVGAALFLGERMALRRILAIAAALAGALIILRPGLREIGPGHYAMQANAVLFATSYLIAKTMSGRASAPMVVAMLSVFVTLGLAPFAATVWIAPTREEVAWMALFAALATAAHYTMTRAFAAAPITVTQPVTFLQLVWAVSIGALFFGEGVDPFVVSGGLVIIAAVSFITWREAVLRRRAANAPGTGRAIAGADRRRKAIVGDETGIGARSSAVVPGPTNLSQLRPASHERGAFFWTRGGAGR